MTRSNLLLSVLAAIAALVVAAGCGGSSKGSTTAGATGEGSTMGIEAAALPYKILRAQGGQEIPVETLVAELAGAKAVCVGEGHKNPHHHWAQLMLLRSLADQAKAQGTQLALGMEMFQRPFQGVVDDYSAGKIDEKQLLERTAWNDRWGYDYGLYRPMVVIAHDEKLPILALNAQKELTRKVAHEGLAALTPEEKAQLPELDLANAEHKEFFAEATEGHAMPGAGMDNFYAAQVIWDETMANTAAAWLAGGDKRQVMIMAGLGHCHRAAVPARIARRGQKPSLSVLPVIDEGEGVVADLLAKPESDYLIVMTMPPHAHGEGEAEGGGGMKSGE